MQALVLRWAIYFFVDNSLIFTRTNTHDVGALKLILQSYEATTGQRVNLNKLAITLSPNTKEAL